jgi:hypothetical protein
VLVCALLTLMVLGGAVYTALRWTTRQAIVVPDASSPNATVTLLLDRG